jgi:hypothetical protein
MDEIKTIEPKNFKGYIDFALQNEARIKKCSVDDLEVKIKYCTIANKSGQKVKFPMVAIKKKK